MTNEAHDDALPDDAAALAEPVRGRLVQLTAQVLPVIGVVPLALRKVASFAPQRRARLGGTQILAALGDADFRGRVVTQLTAQGSMATLVGPLADGADDLAESRFDDHDPIDVAAVLWLARPAGWVEAYDAAVARHTAERADAKANDSAALDRLQQRVDALTRDLRDQRSAQKDQLDELRAENTLLRRRLGEARATARTAHAEAEASASELREGTQRSAAAVGAAEGEARRLRKQIVDLQAQLSAQRTEQRTDRGDANQRARLLLDTVVNAAQGLQRELALPPVEVRPAERYEAAMEAAEGSRLTSAAGALGAGSPALLEQLLTMPRARLIVDGYNVTKQAWGSSSLEVQRLRLVNGLAPVVARTGAETTVVFDAATSPTRPVVAAPRGVRVLFSPENVIADDVIRDLVTLEPTGRVVIVVTSDQAVARDVRRNGASVMDSVALAGLLAR